MKFALCPFDSLSRNCLKWCQDPGNSVPACAMQTKQCTPGRPYQAPAMRGHVLAGAAGAEAGDEPHPDPGLAAGWGPVQPQSDLGQARIGSKRPAPRCLHRPRCALDLSWAVLVLFSAGTAVEWARVSSEGQRGYLARRWCWSQVRDHHSGPQSWLCLRQRWVQVCTWHLSVCVCMLRGSTAPSLGSPPPLPAAGPGASSLSPQG